MAHGEFVWCDLSAHNAGPSRDFYKRIFGWHFSDQGGGYHFASKGQYPVAGHYQMPEKFIKIGMPAFWMSYIAVTDVQATVDLANTLGAKVELGPAEFDGGGTYALIRDPLGAGFTVYSGRALGEFSDQNGGRMGHGLFVSDASKVIPFYTALFDWDFGTPAGGVYAVTTGSGYSFSLHEIPDPAVRGKEEFWAVYFATENLETLKSSVDASGGETVADMALPEGDSTLFRDPDGGAFVAVQSAKTKQPSFPLPWKAWAGIALTLILVFSNLLWPWAIFFAAWVFEAFRTGETYLFERITRARTPRTFWIIALLYATLGVLCLPIWGALG